MLSNFLRAVVSFIIGTEGLGAAVSEHVSATGEQTTAPDASGRFGGVRDNQRALTSRGVEAASTKGARPDDRNDAEEPMRQDPRAEPRTSASEFGGNREHGLQFSAHHGLGSQLAGAAKEAFLRRKSLPSIAVPDAYCAYCCGSDHELQLHSVGWGVKDSWGLKKDVDTAFPCCAPCGATLQEAARIRGSARSSLLATVGLAAVFAWFFGGCPHAYILSESRDYAALVGLAPGWAEMLFPIPLLVFSLVLYLFYRVERTKLTMAELQDAHADVFDAERRLHSLRFVAGSKDAATVTLRTTNGRLYHDLIHLNPHAVPAQKAAIEP